MEHLDPGYILELALGALKGDPDFRVMGRDRGDGDGAVPPEVVVGDLADGKAGDATQALEPSPQPTPLLLQGVATGKTEMQDEETDDHGSA